VFRSGHQDHRSGQALQAHHRSRGPSGAGRALRRWPTHRRVSNAPRRTLARWRASC